MLERQHRNLARYDSSIRIEGIMVEEKIYPRKENDNDEEILWNRKWYDYPTSKLESFRIGSICYFIVLTCNNYVRITFDVT